MPFDAALPDTDANTHQELRRQMLTGPLNRHHRLPGSRGGKYPRKEDRNRREQNFIDINEMRHELWHILTQNKVATEIAVQFNMWWVRDHIFRNYSRQKFECRLLLPETVGRRTRWLWGNVPADTMDMSAGQARAWDNLFGPNTPPEIVRLIVNEFLIHPETPLFLVPHART